VNVFSGARTTVHFHNKFDVVHSLQLLPVLEKTNKKPEQRGAVLYFFEIEYTTAVRGLPHSRHLALNREVINPHDGHILCDPDLATSGFALRIQRSSKIVNSTMSRPKEMLVAFIMRPSWRVLR
jgi:hypothetical protein